ncbi:hypothetical protein EMIT074MI3_11309 [Bacillus licheniformis]
MKKVSTNGKKSSNSLLYFKVTSELSERRDCTSGPGNVGCSESKVLTAIRPESGGTVYWWYLRV